MNTQKNSEKISKASENIQEITIERCPHDKENPYTMVSRELIRDQKISLECRWLLIYLLSMETGWRTNAKEIWKHTSGFAGRNKVWKLLKEAINAGYIRLEHKMQGNLRRGVKYYVSEYPKFKNSNNFSDTPILGASKVGAHKKDLLEEEGASPPFPSPTEEKEIQYQYDQRVKNKRLPPIRDEVEWKKGALKKLRKKEREIIELKAGEEAKLRLECSAVCEDFKNNRPLFKSQIKNILLKDNGILVVVGNGRNEFVDAKELSKALPHLMNVY